MELKYPLTAKMRNMSRLVGVIQVGEKGGKDF
jgi:hypothetical protein